MNFRFWSSCSALPLISCLTSRRSKVRVLHRPPVSLRRAVQTSSNSSPQDLSIRPGHAPALAQRDSRQRVSAAGDPVHCYARQLQEMYRRPSLRTLARDNTSAGWRSWYVRALLFLVKDRRQIILVQRDGTVACCNNPSQLAALRPEYFTPDAEVVYGIGMRTYISVGGMA